MAFVAASARPLEVDLARRRREPLQLELVDADDGDGRAGLAGEGGDGVRHPGLVRLRVGGEHDVHGGPPV